MLMAEEVVRLPHPIPENVMEELDKTTREAADSGQRWATYYDWRTVETWYLPKEIKSFCAKQAIKTSLLQKTNALSK